MRPVREGGKVALHIEHDPSPFFEHEPGLRRLRRDPGCRIRPPVAR
jgi:hypothetical protein